MAGVTLYDYQLDAINRMKIGCILCGGVGSGKSRTSLAFYYRLYGGQINTKEYARMTEPPDLYIITTARKRDTGEWDEELAHFYMSTDPELDIYEHSVTVDSWNNIEKYVGVKNAFVIFDEQRVVGSGKWVKSFLKIAKENEWILLSATPGDCWTDYIPVFIANGFFRNRTEFNNQHVVYSRFSKYPKIDRYLNTQRLVRLRERILVDMDFERATVSHHENIFVNYDKPKYLQICKNRWNPWEDAQQKVSLISMTPDARTLSSGTPQENLYADFSNELKALARKARKEAANMKGLVYSPAAAKEYRAEVDSINAKLESVIANKPKERRAMVIANANIKAKIQALDLDPKLDKKEIKKISSVEMQRARDSIGASGSKTRITFTDREWEAVQKGAISDSKLTKILNASKSDEIVKRAMPKTATVITNAKMAKAKAMLANGYTYNEIAKACGVPESTVYSALNK